MYKFLGAPLFFGFLLNADLAEARSVTLVIGNSAYEHAETLPNGIPDATDIAAALTRQGHAVTLVQDADFIALRRALLEFQEAAQKAENALIYFAGYGFAVEGETWLAPIDAELSRSNVARLEAFPLERFTSAVLGASGFRLVIIDAAYEISFGEGALVGAGLAETDPPGGVLVWYASRHGAPGERLSGRNSVFTRALLRHIETPGLEAEQMFRYVAADVRATTPNRQTPWQYGVPAADSFYFAAPEGGRPDNEAAPSDPGSAADEPAPSGADFAAFALSISLEDPAARIEALQAFLALYPETELRRAAEREIEAAGREQQDPVEAAWLALAGSRSSADLEAFQQRYSASPFAEAAAQRLAELRGEFRAAQEILQRFGCYDSAIDGLWGGGSRRALRQFERASGASDVDGVLSVEDLSVLRRTEVSAGRSYCRPARAAPAAAVQPSSPTPPPERPSAAVAGSYDGRYAVVMSCGWSPGRVSPPFTSNYTVTISGRSGTRTVHQKGHENYNQMRFSIDDEGRMIVTGEYASGNALDIRTIRFRPESSGGPPFRVSGPRGPRECEMTISRK